MTGLLLRLFVKNHNDTENPVVRSAYGKLAGAVGIVCNLLLFAGKLLAGILSGSVAVTADAVNNLSDASSSLVTLLGFKLAERPADEEHPYGHARIEYISGLVVAALILLIGAELAKSSFSKILHPETVEFSLLTLGVLIGSILVKLWMALFCRKLGRRIDSTTLLATSADSRNDVISTAAVLVGCLAGYFFDVKLDGYIGMAVALFIIWSGCSIAKDTINPLLGERASEELVRNISDLILSHEKILGIHDLMVHDYGPGNCFASVHAEMDSAEDPLICHDIIDDIVIVEIRQITILEAVELLLERLDVEATVLDEAVNAVHLIIGDRIITECVIDIGLADGVLVLLRLLAERFDLLDELLLADFRLFIHLLFGGLLIRCFLSSHTTLLSYIPWR